LATYIVEKGKPLIIVSETVLSGDPLAIISQANVEGKMHMARNPGAARGVTGSRHGEYVVIGERGSWNGEIIPGLSIHKLVGRDRVLAHSAPRGIVDSICHCRGCSCDSNLADTARSDGIELRVGYV
jgi:hypothetical protein